MVNSPKNNSVLIVILNYMTYSMTLKLIEAIKSTLDYPHFEILVVDNDSPNESGPILYQHKMALGFELIISKINGGYAAGNNIGIRYAIQKGYEYTWILNNDIRLKSSTLLKAMVAAMEENPSIAVVSPQIYFPDGAECYQHYFRPTLWDMSFGIARSKTRRKAMDNSRSQGIYRPQGCCMLLRNESMQAIDCMDERTFLYGEEEILAERLLKRDMYCWYCANEAVIHMESTTVNSVQNKKNKIKRVLASQELYLKYYRNFSKPARILCKMARGTVILIRN